MVAPLVQDHLQQHCEYPLLPMLLDLPPELRAHIYEYLLPNDPLLHPIDSVALSSVSHRPPTISLLLACHALTKEILSHYYHHAIFKLVLSHAFNFYRVDPNLINLSKHPILQRFENVELVFFCDGVLVKEFPSFGPDRACQEVQRRAERAVDVLEKAAALQRVIVSWVDPGVQWGTSAETVRPVRRLLEYAITLEVGEVLGMEGARRKILVSALKNELACNTDVLRNAPNKRVASHALDLETL